MPTPRPAAALLAAVLLLLAMPSCSDSGSSFTAVVPGTAIEPTADGTAPTSVASTTATNTQPAPTTTAEATTTVAAAAAVRSAAEVQAIIQDLEERRMAALFAEDEAAFRALFANDALADLSVEVVGTVEFVAEPETVRVAVDEVLADTGECVAARVFLDLTQPLGPAAALESVVVVEQRTDGAWGYSYEGAEWLCEGPHPLGP